ncbi:NADH-quinone oxidoreductase subunit NuoE [Granulosicoccus antarcticus]|uniref:NADH-quinone oxidoreductase subunit E n=1 Tax=Granulosicoccus antarcticus IMCC3135 TaxID=1192854 RepID=A0A2Z2NRE4_9GAMM|nr:NAD(P)H-dependent oxidoreductase subunit E [Granulosicoccus antarcticus]ASJ72308.1 NADH-quinone oxidoreductase chain 2 [Granulosicoccus antarcticus IMCC3135]
MSSVPADVNLPDPESVLSEHSIEEINEWMTRFPDERKQSAVLAALSIAQHQNQGWLSTELMDAVAAKLEMPPIAVYEVASFYSMFETRPVGRHCVAICTNISCMLMGSDNIVNHVEKKYGIKLGESTEDGKIYLKVEEECLAACSGGPMMQVDHVYHTQLDPGKVDEILDALD